MIYSDDYILQDCSNKFFLVIKIEFREMLLPIIVFFFQFYCHFISLRTLVNGELKSTENNLVNFAINSSPLILRILMFVSHLVTIIILLINIILVFQFFLQLFLPKILKSLRTLDLKFTNFT